MRNNRRALSVGSNFTPRPKFLGALKKNHSGKLTDQLKNYVVSNLISVVTAVGSFIGGMVILIYFGSIQYFPPELDLSSISLLLAAAAVTGLLLTLLLALYFVIPGYFYRHMLHEQWRSLQSVTLSGRAIFWLLDVPTIVAIWLVTMVAIFQPNNTAQLLNWSFLLIVLILLGFGVFIKTIKGIKPIKDIALDAFQQFKRKKWESVKTTAVAAFSIVVSGGVASIPLLFTLVLVARYEQSVHDENLVWLAFVEMSLFAIFANHLIAGSKKLWVLFAVAPLVLFAMLGVTQQWSLIPEMVVRAFALGNTPNVTLRLDEQGCQIAGKYAYLIQEVPKDFSISAGKNGNITDSKNQKNSVTCLLSSATLLWRIGNEYFVEAEQIQYQAPRVNQGKKTAGKQPKQKQQQQQDKQSSSGNDKKIAEDELIAQSQSQSMSKSRFTIPSIHVLSWTVIGQKKSNIQ